MNDWEKKRLKKKGYGTAAIQEIADHQDIELGKEGKKEK